MPVKKQLPPKPLKCLGCNNLISGDDANEHIKNCLQNVLPKQKAKQQQQNKKNNDDDDDIAILQIWSSNDDFIELTRSRYQVFVACGTSKTLEDLDQFLRSLWLNCCGHLSSFHAYPEDEADDDDEDFGDAPGTNYYSDFSHPSAGGMLEEEGDSGNDLYMADVTIGAVNPRLEHTYDFGTTSDTYIERVKVIKQTDQLKLPPPSSSGFYVLIRNLLPIVCNVKNCNHKSTGFCFVCGLNHCSRHGHKPEEELVNSPRQGKCGGLSVMGDQGTFWYKKDGEEEDSTDDDDDDDDDGSSDNSDESAEEDSPPKKPTGKKSSTTTSSKKKKTAATTKSKKKEAKKETKTKKKEKKNPAAAKKGGKKKPAGKKPKAKKAKAKKPRKVWTRRVA